MALEAADCFVYPLPPDQNRAQVGLACRDCRRFLSSARDPAEPDIRMGKVGLHTYILRQAERQPTMYVER